MTMARIPLFITVLLTTFVLSCASVPRSPRDVGSFIKPRRSPFVGGVYAMSNNVTENTMVVYARRPDGTLQLLDGALKTGGTGAVLAPDAVFDPLFSSFSVIITDDNRFVLAVNAGSSSVSVFRVLPDFSLALVHVQPVAGFGPNSIAISRNIVYVAITDADGEFDSVFSQEGALFGFALSSSGRLIPIPRSQRRLSFRPSGITFSPDRRTLVVTNLFAGLNAIAAGGVREIFTYSVSATGLLSVVPVANAASTELGNSEGRNLPGAIGLEVVEERGVQYVVVPEVRSLAGADGMAPADQAASVSTWALDSESMLSPVQLDVPVGPSVSSGQMDSCWIMFSNDLSNFWVASTPTNATSVFSFEGGISTLEEEVAASVTFPVDLWLSSDSKFLYQLQAGSVSAFEIGDGGSLTLIQNPVNIPDENAQGIVAF